MCDKQLPLSLVADAEKMLTAILNDLREFGDLEIITTRDSRLPQLMKSALIIMPGDDPWSIWQECMTGADAVWIIAPETDGILLKLQQQAEACGAIVIGCDSAAIEITTSKTATAARLSAHGIAHVPTYQMGEGLPESGTGWIIKPDDGVGTEQCYYFETVESIRSWRCNEPERFVIQPYVSGLAASISVLYHAGETVVLSCNEQIIRIQQGVCHHDGVVVNGLSHRLTELQSLAEIIGRVIPGLHGYVGIDLILTDQTAVVVEINPRLTTSYAELHHVLGINIGALIINCFINPQLSLAGVFAAEIKKQQEQVVQ